MMRLGFKPTLAVRGRKTGEWRTVPVNVLDLDGARYLIAPRGETHWVRNLRAVGEGELRRRGERERFRAVEVEDVAEKVRIIAAYQERWGKETKSQFAALPDPVDHPVFRIEGAD
jgi:deazaflavin-dependent oxidoreductase (nitroreductase family)